MTVVEKTDNKKTKTQKSYIKFHAVTVTILEKILYKNKNKNSVQSKKSHQNPCSNSDSRKITSQHHNIEQ